MNILYPAIIEKDEAGYFFVSFPDLTEAITEGETLDEALINASEVLTLTLESRMDEGIGIPHPSKIEHAYLIAPSVRIQSALLMRRFKEKSNQQITKTLENPHQWPTLKELEKAANALGKSLVISLEPFQLQEERKHYK